MIQQYIFYFVENICGLGSGDFAATAMGDGIGCGEGNDCINEYFGYGDWNGNGYGDLWQSQD